MISNGTQPAFWLEVRKEYVVDNFERLLSYLRYYTYTRGEDEQSDFNKSLQCLGEVVADLVDAMSADCLYKHVGTEWGDSWELNVRMIGAYLLASEKKGVQQRQLLLQAFRLVRVVVHTGQQSTRLSHLRRINNLVELLHWAGQHPCRPPVLAIGNHNCRLYIMK